MLSLGAGNIHEAATLLSTDVKQMDELQTVMGRGTIKLPEV